jgi:hypothetical protein
LGGAFSRQVNEASEAGSDGARRPRRTPALQKSFKLLSGCTHEIPEILAVRIAEDIYEGITYRDIDGRIGEVDVWPADENVVDLGTFQTEKRFKFRILEDLGARGDLKAPPQSLVVDLAQLDAHVLGSRVSSTGLLSGSRTRAVLA